MHEGPLCGPFATQGRAYRYRMTPVGAALCRAGDPQSPEDPMRGCLSHEGAQSSPNALQSR